MNRAKRVTAILLSLMMVFVYMPAFSFAASEEGTQSREPAETSEVAEPESSEETVQEQEEEQADYEKEPDATAEGEDGEDLSVEPKAAKGTSDVTDSGTCGDNLSWTLESEGVLTISGSGSMTSFMSVSSAPWYSNRANIKSVVLEEGVTSIGDYAFYQCSSLTSVEIPEGVTSIEDYAFYGCSSLTSVVIPESVTSMGESVFNGCFSLVSAVIPESMTSISDETFFDCSSLTNVEIPEGVTSIGTSAFNGCSKLTGVEIPEGVTSIGSMAFDRCISLTSVKIPEAVTSIGDYAFGSCTSLTSIVIPQGVTRIREGTFRSCSNLTSVVIPEGVTSIGAETFNGCSSLTSIEIPDGVTSIGLQAFYECSNLTSIEIPESVTSIGFYAFNGCSSLNTIYYGGTEAQWNNIENRPTAAKVYYLGDGPVIVSHPENITVDSGDEATFKVSAIGNGLTYQWQWKSGSGDWANTTLSGYNTDTLKLSAGDVYNGRQYRCIVTDKKGNTVESEGATLTIAGITIIDSGTCGDNLTWTLDSDGLLTISGNGNMTNYNASNLAPWYSKRANVKSVVIEEGVTSIGDSAFYKCSNLTNVEIFGSVTRVGDRAFYECSSLMGLDIPAGVTYIGTFAFYECSSLEIVVIPDSVTSIMEYAFYGCSSLTRIDIPEGMTRIRDNVFFECSSLTSVTIPDGMTHIGLQAFFGCSSLTSIEIPGSVTSIGGGAFAGCSNLTSVEIPKGVTSIEEGVFTGCSSLTSVEIPEGVTRIRERAFAGCSNLTSVEIPKGVTSIETDVFYECSSLMSVTIPEGVTSIGTQAFYRCSSLKSVVIPEGVTSIGHSAFYECSGLTSVEIPESVTSIGEVAFYGCSSLKSVVIPEGVTRIGNRTFFGCRNLTSVDIPDSVTSIEEYAFCVCSSLTSVEIPGSVTNIGDNAFNECSSLVNVVIPEGVTSIGAYAFYACNRLTSIYIPDTVIYQGGNLFDPYHNIDIYTIPGAYISSIGNDYWHIVYMCDGTGPDTSHIGFSTDTITMKNGTVLSLGDYLLSDFSLDECAVTLSNEDLFIYDSGELANLEAGECDVTVSKDELSASVRIIAQEDDPSAIEQLSFKETSLSMTKGEVTIETVTMNPANANAQDIAWTTSDDTIITVDNGIITAVGAGTATVTAQSKIDSSIKASCEVTVTVPLYDICLIDDGPIIMEKGASKTFRYYKYPSDAADAAITFSSSDPGVVEISDAGKMTAKGAGTATITISSGQISKTCDVQVYIPIKGITLDHTTAQVPAGETLQLNVIYEPADTTERDVVWTSNKESVATVDENGLVTAHGKGIATITATAGKYTAKCSIVCPNVPLTGISLEDQTLSYGQSYTPEITYIPSTTTDDKTATWQSSDESVFTVSDDGTVTPTGIGTATLTATVGEFTASSEITVVKGVPEYTIPEGLTASCGQKLSEISLPEGFSWADGSRSVGNKGTTVAEAIFTPEDTEHYYTEPGLLLTIQVDHRFDEEWSSNDSEHWHECACGEKVEISEHSFGEWSVTKEPACTEKGEKERSCSVCGYIEKEDIEATDHDWEDHYTVDVEPTCTTEGSESIHCSRCVATNESRTIPALGHDWSDWSVTREPTYTEEGERHRTCSRCDAEETETIAKLEMTITKQPEDVTVNAGKTATFKVEAKGDGLTYQWQYKNPKMSAFANTGLAGNKTDTLSFNATAAFDGIQFRCVVTDETGQSVTSEAATLTVRTGPKITMQPEDEEIAAGTKATFKVAAQGDGLTYQWQYKNPKMSAFANTGLAGNKTDTLSFNATAAFDGIKFRCIVTDEYGLTATSEPATLTIKKGPEVTSQPESVTIAAGTKATFKITAKGDGLTYQWQYKNPKMSAFANTGLSGNKTDTLAFNATAAFDGIQFRCVVTDENGQSVTSDVATLTIGEGPEITSQPESIVIAAGTKATFKVVAKGEGLTYQWQYKNTKMSAFANTGLSGNKTDTLSFNATAAFDGIQFRCVVTDKNGNSVTSDVAKLTIGEGPEITSQPESIAIAAGTKATFKVTAKGEGLTYQWQYKNTKMSAFANTGLSGNKTDTLSFNVSEAFDGIQFRCVVTDKNGNSVTSEAAKLTIGISPEITSQPEDAAIAAGATATFKVTAKGEGLTYQWQYKNPKMSAFANTNLAGNKTDTLSFNATAAFDGIQFRCVVTDSNGVSVTSRAATLIVN